MSVLIRQVRSSQDLKTFIYLPEKIHKDHLNWLPPLYVDEKNFFNVKKNPQFEENETILFLAFKDSKAVGRIMGIIPKEFNSINGVHTARFSYLECYDDEEVFNALLKSVQDWARPFHCTTIIGPMGFSDKEPQGFLTKGFEEKTMMVTNHSFQYMKKIIERAGFSSFVELCQYEVPLSRAILQRYEPITERVMRNLQIKVQEFRNTKEIQPFVQRVFQLINRTYTDIYGFTRVTEQEASEFAKRFIPLLNPKLVKLILDRNENVVAFV